MWDSHGAFAGNHFLLGGAVPSLSGEVHYPGLFGENLSETKWHLRAGYRPPDSARLSNSYYLSPTRDLYFSGEREIGAIRMGTCFGDLGIRSNADDDFERMIRTGSGAVWLETPWTHVPGAAVRGNLEDYVDSESSYDSIGPGYSGRHVTKGDERKEEITAELRSGSLRLSITPEHLPTATVIGYDTEVIRRDTVLAVRVFYRYPSSFIGRDTLYDTVSARSEKFISYHSQKEAISGRLLLLPNAGPTSVVTVRAALTRYRWSTGADTSDFRFSETDEGYVHKPVSGDYYRDNMWEKAEADIELFECFPFKVESFNIFVGLQAGVSFSFLSFEAGEPFRKQIDNFFSEYASSRMFVSVPILAQWGHRGLVVLGDWKPGYYSDTRRKQLRGNGTKMEDTESTRKRNLRLEEYSLAIGYVGYKSLSLWVRPKFKTKLKGLACEIGVRW